MDSDAKCNPVDSIGSSTKSWVSHSEPAFCSVSRGQRRFGEKEYRAPSGTPGLHFAPELRGLGVPMNTAQPSRSLNAGRMTDDQAAGVMSPNSSSTTPSRNRPRSKRRHLSFRGRAYAQRPKT